MQRPETDANQHFIELSSLRNLLQQILSRLWVTDTGVTSTPPTACYMTRPREEGSFWGQESS